MPDKKTSVPEEILEQVSDRASLLDKGEDKTRTIFPEFGKHQLLGLGAPQNANSNLPDMARVISDVAERCMSTAFSLWAHRMTIEYLSVAQTDYAASVLPGLVSGQTLGVTGMASAFREAAGCGSLEITATETEDGYVLDGPIRWASNLYQDSLLVTAVRTDKGKRIIVALPLHTAGVTVGKPFSLLALDSTESTYITLDHLQISKTQVLSTDFDAFITQVRPTFLVLQTALCVGLGTISHREARTGLTGVNAVFSSEVETVGGRVSLVRNAMLNNARAVGSHSSPSRQELLAMRLTGAEVATAAATLEAKTAGGKGYAKSSDSSRRFREAAFLPVQSPSEAQLRWELASCS
ncbi:acyl-CoA dehydrogenase [Nesterenkonia salmonea]|uniref:Acyl-CoA dehydrogenase n=2 Tax=Nesterenkonia salmonea TaxID=1804987 RepID=A0A5R9B8D3_9MICC|nr:acyl-CoA dehydrogenase [Nesterenkonia salmonea]